MKDYVSPVIFDNDEVVEGVYAAGSGGSDCWVMTYYQDQKVNNGSDSFATFRIDATHNTTGVKHISRSTTMLVNYAGPDIKGIEVDGVKAPVGGSATLKKSDLEGFELTCVTTSGCIITRHYLGDAYESGDKFNILVRINDKDGTSQITGLSWSCEHEVNVHNEYD